MKNKVNKNLDFLFGIKIAHRGLWNKDNPENSIGAYKRCIEKNIPIELDVHNLKDNTLVVFHDVNTMRMTGKNVVLKNAIYDDIKDLKLKGTDYGIPTFSEVLDFVDGKVLLDIEIKYDVKNFKICREVCKYLDNYKGDFIVKSFNPVYVLWFRLFRPNYIRGLLISKINDKNKITLGKKFLYFLANPFFIVTDYNNVFNKYIKKIKEIDFPILLYTLKKKDMDKYNGYGRIFEE